MRIGHIWYAYGLGENTGEPGSKATTNTKVAEGLMWIVSCNEAGFFLVPDTKAVSKGILLFMSAPVRKLYSNRLNCSLFNIFLNKVPESKVDICASSIIYSPLFCYEI